MLPLFNTNNLAKPLYAALGAMPKPVSRMVKYVAWKLMHTGLVSLLLPSPKMLGDFSSIEPKKKTVLIVSHEGSRTGAPVLSYNLVNVFLARYNVIALFLGPGPMLESCYAAGAIVIGPVLGKRSAWLSGLAIKQIINAVQIEFALVNSIEARYVLPALTQHYIPAISLIHEFSAYTRPHRAFRDAVFWSSQAVFSTPITRDNMLSEFPDLGERDYPVIPQGRCILPQESRHADMGAPAEIHRIQRTMRPEHFPADGVVILGVGFVQFRKGVDLFIECAARIQDKAPDLPFRFIWVGKGYDPEKDVAYSAYLADQILRAGLAGKVQFMDEVTNLDSVYDAANILLLSSRLDPLPNVAIDAIANGLPVVCFNKTTGIADILSGHGLGNECVANYLNTKDMACKVLALALSQELRSNVAEKARCLTEQVFHMGNYVSRLERLALQEVDRVRQEKLDIETIEKSGFIRLDFYCAPHWPYQSMDEALRGYVRAWASGVRRRKPVPGFHPGIYLEQHRELRMGVDPLADYLRKGQPQGPWNFQLITARDVPQPLPPKLRIGLHVHAYYPDLFPEIIQRLQQNRIRPDLLVSVSSESARQEIAACLATYEGAVDVRIVPNRGRDIGPFLTEFGRTIQQNYDLIGHLHTKRTASFEDESIGKNWYDFLLDNLLGGRTPMADIILGRMANDHDVAMVFPDDPYVVGWGANRSFAENLFPGLGKGNHPSEFNFPVGTMFWARPRDLEALFALHLNWEDYPEEPLPQDGTMLHALERLFGLVAMSGRSSVLLTNVAGVTR